MYPKVWPVGGDGGNLRRLTPELARMGLVERRELLGHAQGFVIIDSRGAVGHGESERSDRLFRAGGSGREMGRRQWRLAARHGRVGRVRDNRH